MKPHNVLAPLALWLCALFGQYASAGSLPQVSSGELQRLTINSQWIPARQVDVWLPPGYNASQRYAVLYVHDGQMMFDANTTWNGQEWGMDEVAGTLIQQGTVRPFIVAAIHNGGVNRAAEFFPQASFEALSATTQAAFYRQLRGADRFFNRPVYSDDYLRFIFEELKPVVDARYSTLADKDHTFMLGSSMGGLISWYAASRYPNALAGIASISTHWVGGTEDDGVAFPAFQQQLAQLKPDHKVKIYFDSGDATLDALYPKYQRQIDAQMRAAGWPEGQWQSRFFPGADHTENAWQKRLGEPLIFLLGSRVTPAEVR